MNYVKTFAGIRVLHLHLLWLVEPARLCKNCAKLKKFRKIQMYPDRRCADFSEQSDIRLNFQEPARFFPDLIEHSQNSLSTFSGYIFK